MKDSYNAYATIPHPIPTHMTATLLTELSKCGWEAVSLSPVQVQVSKLANTQPQTGYLIVIKKELPINAQPVVPHIEIADNGIKVIEKSAGGNDAKI